MVPLFASLSGAYSQLFQSIYIHEEKRKLASLRVNSVQRPSERERREEMRREDNTLLHKDKALSTIRFCLFVANLSLMTNTATLNTSNKNSERERERVTW